jgi:hypothetical protein
MKRYLPGLIFINISIQTVVMFECISEQKHDHTILCKKLKQMDHNVDHKQKIPKYDRFVIL